MNKVLAICAFALLASTTGCVARLVDFTVISTKNQVATEGLTAGPRTEGSDCVAVVFVPFGSPNLKAAIDNAIEKAGPGYDALVDGVVNIHNKSFLFGSYCYEVTGTPINTHSKKTAALVDHGRVWAHSGGADTASDGLASHRSEDAR